MTKKKMTNDEIVNSMHSEMGETFRDTIPLADTPQATNVQSALNSSPNMENEFINALINKVVHTAFFTKVNNNPLKFLHRGVLEYGDSVEQITVGLAERKGYGEHFTGSLSEEGDLIKATKTPVHLKTITKNFAYKYKSSINSKLLKNAFTRPTGLSQLIDNLVDSVIRSAEFDEYTNMLGLITRPTATTVNGSDLPQGVIARMIGDEVAKTNMLVSGNANATTLVKNIKTKIGQMSFLSNKYNIAQVPQLTNKNEFVVFVTPQTMADIDVSLLATAFNVSYAEISERIVMVDTLGTDNGTTPKEVLCVVADRDLIQSYDTINETHSFFNADTLTTNIFHHRQGIYGVCDFAQFVVFTK